MPNLEQITAADLKHLKNIDVILCKTNHTCEAFDALVKEQGLTSLKTVFMSHSTPDTYQNAIDHLGASRVEGSHRDYNKFFHVYGGSGRKSTAQVLDCWMQHHDWPTLTIVGRFSEKD
ncbi:hypothetical protein BDR26DRAFT_854761 [Obelidium mucronatum]|nr:hypothetical protein BDR26DRAFT_854761 [Obelidium mucronatum]